MLRSLEQMVDRTLYCVHRYFFSRDSAYFSTGLAQFDIRDHETLPTIISLDKIERNDFDAFLSVFYPESFEENDRSYEQWKSVLHLSTRWGFASMRKLALATINPPTPYDRLLLARTYSVDHWVVPALSALCEKAEPLTFSEAREMDIGDVVLVATVRENIRSHKLQVDAVDVPHHVEAALEGILGIYPKQSAKEEEAHGIGDEQSVSSNSAQRGATTRRTGTEVTVAPKAVSRGREAATVREGAAAPEGEVAVASARGIRVMEAAVVREAVARVEATTANNFLMAAKRRTGLDANVGRFIF
ncbi:hypothetical protein F5148DRAFT_496055 [Russula earlei]|uniref:Uncharacterized protein n=1 Tax=Russula earlei TaxID=71964 RepID=A0ACC0TYG8_9AGAM|nr:hypothetical protein F5148DRAFT_496055 [Russula earlei]